MSQSDSFKLTQNVGMNVERGRKAEQGLKFEGYHDVEIWRDGKLHHKERLHNGVKNFGKDEILDAEFRNQTQPTNWYLGFIDNAGTPTEAAGDTSASHAGWTEEQSYDEATRPEWVTVAAASQSITNTTPASFTVNATKTLYGIFVISVSTKGGTTGTLWSTAAFTAPVPVISGDIIKITYTVNAT